MRKSLLSLALFIILALAAAAPSLANTPSPLYFDWSAGASTYAAGLNSFGLLVGVSDPDSRWPLYLDADLEYGDGVRTANLGLVLRAPGRIIIFKPYVGAGLVYNLDDWYPAWRTAPYVLAGAELLWFFWENAAIFTPYTVENTVRAGVRVGF